MSIRLLKLLPKFPADVWLPQYQLSNTKEKIYSYGTSRAWALRQIRSWILCNKDTAAMANDTDFFLAVFIFFSAAASFYFLLSYCWRVHVFIVKACMRGIKSFKHSFTILCRLSSGNPSNLSLTTTKSNFAPPSHFPSDKSVTETCDASRSERHCGYVLPRVGRRQRGRR